MMAKSNKIKGESESKNRFLKNISKTGKPLASLIQKNIEKSYIKNVKNKKEYRHM